LKVFHSSVTVETYVGYDRAENFILPGGAVQDGSYVYAAALNEWALSGDWAMGKKGADQ
jgi:Thioredoxin like C-terminal domain